MALGLNWYQNIKYRPKINLLLFLHFYTPSFQFFFYERVEKQMENKVIVTGFLWLKDHLILPKISPYTIFYNRSHFLS